ncbi:hypothetical protein EIP86_010002 [Pleurotus ostreatoroseus]|nr:hypothetical protein EIP86_010002 [Pleurotus ostreatoroseus]
MARLLLPSADSYSATGTTRHLTLTVLDHEQRPLICWAAIGTTTCCSRAVQMWVTSNIVEPHLHSHTSHSSHNSHAHNTHNHNHTAAGEACLKRRSRRRWDWPAVVRACVLPACAVYVVMAWAAVLRREWGACY